MGIKCIRLGVIKNRFASDKLDVVIMGDTIEIKDQLKELGATWDGDSWIITIDKDIHAIGRINKLLKGFETDDTRVIAVSKSQALSALK